jgi:hypothetical protein
MFPSTDPQLNRAYLRILAPAPLPVIAPACEICRRVDPTVVNGECRACAIEIERQVKLMTSGEDR